MDLRFFSNEISFKHSNPCEPFTSPFTDGSEVCPGASTMFGLTTCGNHTQ